MKTESSHTVTITLVLLFLCCCGSAYGAGGLTQKCSNEFQKVAMCLEYATGKAAAPTKDCCSSVKDIRERVPECMCFFIQQSRNGSEEIKKLGIQESRLLQLPSACSVKNSSVADCPKLLGISPSSPDAAVFKYNGSTTAAPATTTGSGLGSASPDGSYGKRLAPNFAVLMIICMVTITLIAFPAGSTSEGEINVPNLNCCYNQRS